MSGLPGNPFAKQFETIEGGLESEAIMALAFEQRTATMVSMHQFAARLMVEGEITGDVNSVTEKLDALSDEINERIGKTE